MKLNTLQKGFMVGTGLFLATTGFMYAQTADISGINGSADQIEKNRE